MVNQDGVASAEWITCTTTSTRQHPETLAIHGVRYKRSAVSWSNKHMIAAHGNSIRKFFK
jgi:hypothetical protein